MWVPKQTIKMADQKCASCVVCKKDVGQAHKCIKCDKFVHVICGHGEEDEEGYGQRVTCFNCTASPTSKVKKDNGKKPLNAFEYLKRKKSEKDNETPVVKKKTYPSDAPYFCLKCQCTVARGSREYYRSRHMQLSHKDLDKRLASTIIVPENHEDAHKIKSKTSLPKVDTNSLIKIDQKEENQNPNTQERETPVEIIESKPRGGKASIQKNITSFLSGEEKEKDDFDLKSEIDQIKLMLTALSLEKSCSSNVFVNSVNKNVEVEKANNLLELVIDDIEVQVLLDGCKVTCVLCKQYYDSQPLSSQRLIQQTETWGTGFTYDAPKTELLASGGNQTWYSFKNSLKDHLNCSSLRSSGHIHLKARRYKLEKLRKERERLDTCSNVVASAIEACKTKTAALCFEHLLGLVSFCGGEIGSIGHGRNLFPDIIAAAYCYVMIKTSSFLKEELPSTNLPPHFSVTMDKSTPHRDTNQAVMIILPVRGKRMAIPIDAPLVYDVNEAIDIVGGSGQDLAIQVISVLKDELKLDGKDLCFIRAIHGDGQYQAATFQDGIKKELKINKNDHYFLMTWDVAHWVDRVMEGMREKEPTCNFFKRLVKRGNRLYTMFGHGKGHVEFKGIAKQLGLKSCEMTTFSTTRFFSSAYHQWTKIVNVYPALIEAYENFREDQGDDCDETRYEIRGQDFILDILGMCDVLYPITCLMTETQAADLAPWKVTVWTSKVLNHLKNMRDHLHQFISGNVKKLNSNLFPRLATNLENILSDGDNGTFKGVQLYAGWMVVGSQQTEEGNSKSKTYTWEARSPDDCFTDFHAFVNILIENMQLKFDEAVPKSVSDMEVLDIEKLVIQLSHFMFTSYEDAADLRKARTEWETYGTDKFKRLFSHLSTLSHIRDLSDAYPDLNLLPHDADLVFRKFKSVLKDVVNGKYGVLENLFIDENDTPLADLKSSRIVNLVPVAESDFSLHQKFELISSSGAVEVATLNENFFLEQMYVNENLYCGIGKECCILYDVILGASGCEAVVEGFYSLVKAHKKNGGQGNDNLIKRAVVDWALPHPIQCPNTIKEIAKLYRQGSTDYGLKKHRDNIFFDKRERSAGKYTISKVVDRLSNQPPKFPYLLDPKDA